MKWINRHCSKCGMQFPDNEPTSILVFDSSIKNIVDYQCFIFCEKCSIQITQFIRGDTN